MTFFKLTGQLPHMTFGTISGIQTYNSEWLSDYLLDHNHLTKKTPCQTTQQHVDR